MTDLQGIAALRQRLWGAGLRPVQVQDVLSRGFALSSKQEQILRRIATKTGVPAWK